MSRVGKKPVELPAAVTVSQSDSVVTVKGPLGELSVKLSAELRLVIDGGTALVELNDPESGNAMRGTTRALLQNMVQGVSKGFERKLELVGVGYRAAAKGSVLSLTLGHSHPIEFDIPEGVSVATPTQTEVLLKAVDKQLLGLVAAKIRGFRPPEPYKGKGVRYAGEIVRQKEAKKK